MSLKNKDYIALSGDTGDFNLLQKDYRLSELALIFPNVNSILIPKKAESNLRKYISKSLLKAIDPNIDIAVEKCLVILSNLASTYYTPENRWKHLSSTILHNQTKTSNGNFIYQKIIDLLKIGTKKGGIIEVDEVYKVKVHSKKYRLTESYIKSGLKEYIIKDAGIIQIRNKMYFEQLSDAVKNPICLNLINIYPKIDLPSVEELLIVGKKLVKENYHTKKCKQLTIRNKHNDNYWKDYDNRSFVEDNIKLFEFLTNRGFMIPSAGDEKSGGRVVDSFTLMPAWIREQITIDGKKLSECDYTALHPNIAIKLYNGKQSYISHSKVAETLCMDLKQIKVEHLSFFNKRWTGMKKSPLFDYYLKAEKVMLKNIHDDKKSNGYKITSMKMFKAEVKIMTEVIRELNSIGIHVLYVYDALLCEEQNKKIVIQTMNQTILKHGVKTHVKNEMIHHYCK